MRLLGLLPCLAWVFLAGVVNAGGKQTCIAKWTNSELEAGCNPSGGYALRLPQINIPGYAPLWVCEDDEACKYTRTGDEYVFKGSLQHKDLSDYKLDVEFTLPAAGYLGFTPPMGSPYLAEGLCNNDGDGWEYWSGLQGTLIGKGPYAGGYAEISAGDFPAYQMGPNANNKNTNYGASAWFHLEIISQPDVDPHHWKSADDLKDNDHNDINIDVKPCEDCVCHHHFDNSPVDPGCQKWGGYAFHLSALSPPAPSRPHFLCSDDSCWWKRHGDNTLELHGLLHHIDYPDLQIYAEVTFPASGYAGTTPPTDDNPYFGSGTCHNGGLGWEYWTEAIGTLTGKGDYVGGQATIDMTAYPAAQLGYSANNKNDHYGFSAWFDVLIDSFPTNAPYDEYWSSVNSRRRGDLNLNVYECDCPPCTKIWYDAPKELGCNANGDFAIRIPAISPDVKNPYWHCNRDGVDPMCTYTRYADNSMEFRGRLQHNAVGDYLIDVVVVFPASGYKGKDADPYYGAGNCGDDADWEYWDGVYGTITGRGAFQGGIASISTDGYPPAQVGTTANNKNTDFGVASWFDVIIHSKPDDAAHAPHWKEDKARKQGDINANMDPCVFYW